MTAQKAGAGALGKVCRPPLRSVNTQRSCEDQSAFTCQDTAQAPQRSSVYRGDPLGAARGLVFGLLFTAIAVALIIGACYLVGFLLAHPAWFIAVVCVAVLAIMATVDRWAA